MNAVEVKIKEEAKTQPNAAREWLFRLLLAAAAGLMLYTWFQPWWTSDIEGFGNDMIRIRPWGLELGETMGDFAILIKGAEMPAWFSPLMWTYLGACMLALLVGMFLLNKVVRLGKIRLTICQLLTALVGFSYIVAGIVAAVYASIRMEAMGGVPLQGRVFVDLGDPIIAYVNTRLLPGYFLIYAAGFAFLALAFVQDMITGTDLHQD
jgi:hypothetical protein